jgi:hypothetical protein
MATTRGREARLKKEHAALYPGVTPGVWVPVEKLLQHVTDLIHKDRSRSGVITGRRLLHDEHFEYRGSSARPTGLPEGSTRLSDSGAEPGRRAGLPGNVPERESSQERESNG